MTPTIARTAERQAWQNYVTHCLGWRRKRNYPTQEVFLGDARSRTLFAIFRAARRSLQEVSSPRHARGNSRFGSR